MTHIPHSLAEARFFGWRVVYAAFVVAFFGWGMGFFGPPVFLQAVHENRGWPIELVSVALTTHYLVGASVVANLPRLYRWFGLPIVTTAGAVLLTIGRESMLELRPNCECCDRDLPPSSKEAVICTFECTFCTTCADEVLGGICPNCGGNLVARPIRPPEMLQKAPASTKRVVKQGGCVAAA